MPDFSLAALVANFPWLTFLLALAIAVASVLLLIPVARHTGWVDKPSLRKNHEGNIPLIGGWAILTVMVVLQTFGPVDATAPTGYWCGALLLFVVALVDDHKPIRARYRFMVQFVAAIAGVSLGGHLLANVGDLLGTGALSAWWIVVPVSVLGIVALINAVNFMDGSDGLCGGIGFIGLFWLFIAMSIAASLARATGVSPLSHANSLVPLAAVMMGGLAGFLMFNLRTPWRRHASVFLGDSGSMLVGFTLGWLAINVTTAFGAASVSPVACLWIMAIPLFDSASCITRRILSGVTPMTADTKHLHHLGPRLGFSVAISVFLIHSSAFLCGLVGVTGWWLEIPERVMFGGFGLTLAVFVLVTNLTWRHIDKCEGVREGGLRSMAASVPRSRTSHS